MTIYEESIPELNTRQVDEPRYLGDLCKIDGIIHVWHSDLWHPLSDEMQKVYNAEAAHQKPSTP